MAYSATRFASSGQYHAPPDVEDSLRQNWYGVIVSSPPSIRTASDAVVLADETINGPLVRSKEATTPSASIGGASQAKGMPFVVLGRPYILGVFPRRNANRLWTTAEV